MRIFTFIIICVAFLMGGCASHRDIMVNGVKAGLKISLSWENPGSIDRKAAVTLMVKEPVAIVVHDARANMTLVGHSAENGKNVATKDDLNQAYEVHINRLFTEAGFKVKKTASTIIDITINDLFVEEANTYRGLMKGTVQVIKNDTPVWSNVSLGNAKRWGKSFKEDNYNEALTNTIVDFVDKLTDDQKFLSSIAANI